MAFHHPIIDRPGEASSHGHFIQLDAMGKALKFWQITLRDLLQPGVQSLPFSLVHHREEILTEVIGRLQRWADLAQGSQILSFDVIEGVRVTHKQPDSGGGRKLLKTRQGSRSSHFRLLECFQVPIHTSLRPGVALFLDFAPKRDASPLSLFPTLEDVGSKRAKGALPASRRLWASGKVPAATKRRMVRSDMSSSFAICLGFIPCARNSTNGTIAGIAPTSASQSRFLDMGGLERTPFFETNDSLSLLAALWLLRLTRRHDVSLTSRQQELGSFREIFYHMKAICATLVAWGAPWVAAF